MHVLYLHGFASGPRTRKGMALGARLAGRVRSYAVPDLEAGDFRGLTIDRLRERALAALAALPDDGAPCLLVGSSLGGWLAAHLLGRGLAPRVAAGLLIAPAFDFAAAWQARLGAEAVARWRREGELPFFHHGEERERPLGVAFLDSCQALEGMPGQARCPVAIVHGLGDDTVPCSVSVRYARERTGVELHLVEGDHRLTEPRHEDLIAWCAGDLLARGAGITAPR